MKKMIALLMLCVSLLAACGNDSGVLSNADAIAIALKDAGLKQNRVDDVHTHGGSYHSIPCYQVCIEDGKDYYVYYIDAVTGEILHKE